MIKMFDKDIPKEILEDIDNLANKCNKNKKECFGFSFPAHPVYNLLNLYANRNFVSNLWLSENFDTLKDYLVNVKGYRVETDLLDHDVVSVIVYV